MPELPEVETTRRGIEPHLTGRRITHVVVRQPKLRWPIPPELPELAVGQPVQSVQRRAKYLLIGLPNGSLILHLGMSGSLRVIAADSPPAPHDHVDITLDDGNALRLTDPRRFGALLWSDDPQRHPLIANLGPEPLGDGFDGDWLYRQSRGRRTAVKNLIMDGKVVVGVGNIYASESLFRAGIHPARRADRISRERYGRLADAIRSVLTAAIRAGGTTLRDFVASDGKPGYFAQELAVYGREGEPCGQCGTVIRQIRTGQRSTWYCPVCQR